MKSGHKSKLEVVLALFGEQYRNVNTGIKAIIKHDVTNILAAKSMRVLKLNKFRDISLF